MRIMELVQPKTAKGNDAGDHIEDEGYADHAQRTLADALNASGRDSPGAEDQAADETRADVCMADFYAHMPDHRYIFAPTRDLWPASSVNSRLPWPAGADGKKVRPTDVLDAERSVEQMVWVPGEPMVIKDRLIDGGGVIERAGVSIFNLYREPTIQSGNPKAAGPWLDHVRRIYPGDADHIIPWLAHRVQRPGEKINHAIVLGGSQGIGKDTLLEPVKHAVGPWNMQEVSPAALLGRFNGFVQSVILRISEARDLGDMDRFAFYDHMKVYTAAPPDVLRCDQKNLREYAVINCCGVIITTNHKADGIYLPADDRRHYVAWSDVDRTAFSADYWTRLYGWYAAGGTEHVTGYLRTLDLSGFDPKAPPPKTEAFWHIVNAARPSEEAELCDLLEEMQTPAAFTMGGLADAARRSGRGEIAEWLTDRKNRRVIPHRLEDVGYEPIRNDLAKDGLWKIDGKRQVVYARRELPLRDRMKAAQQLSW
ncbi:MAG: hypothetical protein IPL00_03340 [Gammaproteobacteria bacterium]|nr:hypothetical protein [Gammaproteobacteria bacterium]